MRAKLPMHCIVWLLLACGQVLPVALAQQAPDSYDAMLQYLGANARIDGHALASSSGAVRVNQAAGDLNLQANLQAMAVGGFASAAGRVWQRSENDVATAPVHASVAISDGALANASGMYAINQVAGSGNAQFNVVAAALAGYGIEEADDAVMAASGAMPAGGTPSPLDQPGTSREVAVAATAMQGFRGVMQLNQVAGSANATGNTLEISVSGGP